MNPSTLSLSTELDEDDALARAGEIVHFVGAAQDGARLFGRGDDDLVPCDLRDADDFDALRWTRVAAAGARAWLDERSRPKRRL